MQQKRILIILVVVLVVIFIVGVVRGPTQGGNNTVSISNIQNGFFGTLHNLFVHPQHLAAQDMQVAGGSSSTCLQSDMLVVPQGGTCNYVIIEHKGASVRTIKLNPTAGSVAKLTLQPEGAMQGTLDIPNPRPNVSLDVYEKGGLLMAACTTGDATGKCRLRLV